MKSNEPIVSGFTIVRNATIMGYPVIESIKSVLPLVDEFVVGLGPCEDDTEQRILQIGSPKIRIIHTQWDSQKHPKGTILSAKTNEALMHCKNNWCIYIQADEVLHEGELSPIKEALVKYANDDSVQGLLFDYVHFYGSYNVVATSRKWYRNEVRAVKKNSGIQSWNDAQGFRVVGKNAKAEKPKVKRANARVFHYGWVKPQQLMGEKKKRLDQLWHGNTRDQMNQEFSFDRFYGLRKFQGDHPAIMKNLIVAQDWTFDYKLKLSEWTFKDINCLMSDMFEKVFQHRIGEYKNYRLL